MPTFTVTISDFLPTRLNALLRMHWAKRGRVLRSEADLVAVAVRQVDVPRATGRRRVSLRFESPRTPADADGRLKGLLDALTACGALVDDGPGWLELGTVESVRGPARRTTICLEDLDGEGRKRERGRTN